MGASHARAYHKMPDFEIVGLVSRGPATRGRISKELGGLPEFSDYYQALASAKPDVVSINTYPETHFAYVKAALEAGCHVFCEKPLAETVEESEALVKLARAKKLSLAFRGTDEYREFGLRCGCNHRLQQDVVRDIEMSESRAFGFQPCQNVP